MGTAFDVLANPLHSNAWLAVLADAAIKGAALLLLAGLLTMAMRRASAAARHLVWSLALTGVLVLPVLSSLLPSWQVPLLPRAADAGIPSIQRPQTWPNAPEEPRRLPADTARFEAPEKPQKRESPTTVERVWKPTAATFLRLADWVPSVWMAGLLAALAPLLLGTAQVWRLARRAKPVAGGLWSQWLGDLSAQIGLKRRVTLLRSPRATMPMTWGILRPVVLLPSDIDNWPDERCRIVLLHEMAHIRRWDCLTQMLARMTCSLHWFNPLAWLAAHGVRAERERACDDMVLGAGSRPSEYAGHLLELARSHNRLRFAPMASVAMARRSPIENRLLAILDDSRSHRALRRVTVTLALVLGAGVLFPLAMVRAMAAPPKSETRRARLPDSATNEDRVAVAKANLAAAKAKAESSLKGLLAAYDHEFFSSYTLRLLVVKPVAVRMRDGLCTATTVLTGNGDVHALVEMNLEIERPRYPSRGPSAGEKSSLTSSFDSQGRYLFGYHKMMMLLSDSRWMWRADPTFIVVAPDDSITTTVSFPPKVEIQPVGEAADESMFFRHILPLGRGYARLIEQITSASVNAEGIARITALGPGFSPNRGFWRLEIDTTRGYLVQHATYTEYSATAPVIVCQGEGLWEAPLPLCRTGTFSIGRDFRTGVSLLDYAQHFDSQLLGFVAHGFDPVFFPKGTRFIDYTVQNRDGAPLRFTKR
jgi:beta-lactamase regulating signal transducer with metallopeptidase domain